MTRRGVLALLQRVQDEFEKRPLKPDCSNGIVHLAVQNITVSFPMLYEETSSDNTVLSQLPVAACVFVLGQCLLNSNLKSSLLHVPQIEKKHVYTPVHLQQIFRLGAMTAPHLDYRRQSHYQRILASP